VLLHVRQKSIDRGIAWEATRDVVPKILLEIRVGHGSIYLGFSLHFTAAQMVKEMHLFPSFNATLNAVVLALSGVASLILSSDIV
jgi:hypothetical protein